MALSVGHLRFDLLYVLYTFSFGKGAWTCRIGGEASAGSGADDPTLAALCGACRRD